MPYPKAIHALVGTPLRNRVSRVISQNLLTSPPALFEGFEDKTVWSTTGSPVLSDDGDIYLSGSKSLHVVTASGVNGVATRVCNYDLSAAGGNLRLYIYFASLADVAKNGGVILYLSSTTNFSKYFTVTLTGFDVGWNVANLRAADWTNSGGDSWASPMIRARVTTTAQAAQQAVINYDKYEKGGVTKPAVMLSFDDVHPSIFQYAYSYMHAKGMVGTVYVISDNIGAVGFETAANLAIMNGNRWDIGNHTKSHIDLTGLSQADVQTEFTTCKGVLDGHGWTRASSDVAYPFGLRSDTVYAAMVAAGMRTGRKVSNPATTLSPSTRLVLPRSEWRTLPTYAIDNAISLATAKTYVDRANTRGEILPLLFHQLVASSAGANQWLISDFQSLIDYIQAAGMQSLTVSELKALESSQITVHHK